MWEGSGTLLSEMWEGRGTLLSGDVGGEWHTVKWDVGGEGHTVEWDMGGEGHTVEWDVGGEGHTVEWNVGGEGTLLSGMWEGGGAIKGSAYHVGLTDKTSKDDSNISWQIKCGHHRYPLREHLSGRHVMNVSCGEGLGRRVGLLFNSGELQFFFNPTFVQHLHIGR